MTYINNISQFAGNTTTLQGWVYNVRSSKSLIFLVVRDGTGLCQCIVNQQEVSNEAWTKASDLTQETSLKVTGLVKKDERSIGGYELHVEDVEVLQIAKDYPITPKEHGIEFLMENRHLWLRSKKQWAIMRIRNQIIFSVHSFFQEQGFIQMDAPIFTGNAAEGTSTLFETQYFDQKAYLTQSGQLYGEAMSMAHGKIYTFGPTFRAEKSKTRRHLTEFWMIEPEMAFYDLNMNMDLAESFVTYVIDSVVEKCKDELEQIGRDVSKLKYGGNFPRISYTEAVDMLRSDKTRNLLDQMELDRNQEKLALETKLDELRSEYGQAKKGRKFRIDAETKEARARMEEIDEDLRNIPVWRESALNKKWGEDFGGSDETVLMLQFDKPIMVYGYPAEIKAFYMKRDPKDEKIALGVDMLAPEGYGEVIGGGQREDDLDLLLQRIKEHNLSEETFRWYLDLRRYGSVPHSGFGLGLERTVAWICGIKHVRETIPFARTLGRLYP
ncbi:MAG: asparagine--tRNA ligase [Balneolales bacterium]